MDEEIHPMVRKALILELQAIKSDYMPILPRSVLTIELTLLDTCHIVATYYNKVEFVEAEK